MSAHPANILDRLRGRLQRSGLGARGLEKLARNPACRRLQALAFAGVKPGVAAREVYGEAPRDSQSPFAIQAGNRFEDNLYADGAKALVKLYRDADLLDSTEDRVVLVHQVHPGRSSAVRAQRRALTAALLKMRLAGDPTAPNLIVHPRLIVDLAGTPHEIEPDALVAADGDRFYRLVEIKSYPDRRGKTDPADLKGARRQMAVGVVALRQALARLGVAEPEQVVLAWGDLVLRVPGSMQASLQPMALKGEVFSLAQMLRGAPQALAEILAMLPAVATLDDKATLDSIPNAWTESCKEHCGLAAVCKGQACAVGDPAVLGGQAREEFAASGSTGRVLELLRGHGAAPTDPAEIELRDRLQAAYQELQTAVGHVL